MMHLNLFISIYLIINIIISYEIAKAARHKQVGTLKVFIISTLFSPLIGLLLSISSDKATGENETDKYKKRAFNVKSS